MKIIKKVGCFLACLCVLGQVVYAEEEEEPEEVEEISPLGLHGFSAVLMDADSGSVLYEEHGEEPHDPASLTKMMTVAIALDQLDTEKTITLSSEAFQTYDHNMGVLWIQEGESMSVLSASYASMLASANDTTAMLAESVAGSVNDFVPRMNQQASTWQMDQTSFDNPFGYASEGNYASALDIAKMVKHLWKQEPFSTIFSSASYLIPPTNQKENERIIAQDCELLRAGSRAYEYALGCKIGSTASGGYSIAVVAEKNDSRMIGVILGCETAWEVYDDVIKLFEYGFSHFQTIVIEPEDIGVQTVPVYDGKKHIADVNFTIDHSYRILLPAGIEPDKVQTEVRILHEDSKNPEEVQAMLYFLLDGVESGQAEMEKEILLEQVALPKTALEAMKYYFDLFSVGVLGLFIFGRIYKVLHRLLAPQVSE